MDELAQDLPKQVASNPRRHRHPGLTSCAHLHFGIYTGLPKGVLATHRSFVNRLHWMWTRYPYGPGERACLKTALSFVDSISELFGPLLQGVPVVLVPAEAGRDVAALIDILHDSEVTRLVLVPSLLQTMLQAYPELGKRLPKLWLWVSQRRGTVLRTRVKFPGRAKRPDPSQPLWLVGGRGRCDLRRGQRARGGLAGADWTAHCERTRRGGGRVRSTCTRRRDG